MSVETTYDNFAKIYESVIRDRRITAVDRDILNFIKCKPDGWRVTNSYIARELDISMSKVIRSINRLDAAGYLDCKIRKTEGKIERRDMVLNHKPKHWNVSSDMSEMTHTNNDIPEMTCQKRHMSEVTHVKSDTPCMSEMTHGYVRNDISGMSEMTYNVELSKSNLVRAIEESSTEVVVVVEEEKRIDTSQIPDEVLMKEDSDAGCAAQNRIVAKAFSSFSNRGNVTDFSTVRSGLVRSGVRDQIRKYGGQS